MVADPDLIAIWIKAWAITRGVAPPVRRSGAYYVDVGLPDQRREDAVRPLLPARWQIRTPPTYMMTGKLVAPIIELPEDHTLSLVPSGGVLTASIHAYGDLAASGRLVIMGDIAIFDQIRTQDAYRRRGFGRAIMAKLAAAALDAGAPSGVLAATEMGRALYETLGWTVHAPYTSAVIPGG